MHHGLVIVSKNSSIFFAVNLNIIILSALLYWSALFYNIRQEITSVENVKHLEIGIALVQLFAKYYLE